MEQMQTLVSFVVGAILGAVAFFWLVRGQLNSLKARSSALETELHAERGQSTAAKVELAGTKERADRADELTVENARLQTEIRDAVTRAAAADSKLSELAASRADFEDKIRQTVNTLAASALSQNTEEFLKLAKEKLEHFGKLSEAELDKRKTAIETLVDPLTENLAEMKKKVEEIETKREGAYQGMYEQIKTLLEANDKLNRQTGNLVTALKSTPQRGRWGEVQLRRLVEMSGMIQNCDFVTQESVDSDEGRKRPDLIVKLPDKKEIIVDSKAVLKGFVDGHECDDDESRAAHFQDFARAVRTQVVGLSQRAYWDQFESPEFVVLFLPGENYLNIALHYDPELLEYAFNNKVILATPTTLLALLKTVAHTWRQEQLAKEAKQIAALGSKMHKGVADFLENFQKVGKSLRKAQEDYDSATSNLTRSVLPNAVKLEQLGAKGKKDLLIDREHVVLEIGMPEETADALPIPTDGLFHDELAETAEP